MIIVESIGSVSLVAFAGGHFAIFDEMELVDLIGIQTSMRDAKTAMMRYYLTETLQGQIEFSHRGDSQNEPRMVETCYPPHG